MNETSTPIQGLKRANNISFVSSAICDGGQNFSILSVKDRHKQLSWNESCPKKTMNLSALTLDY